MPRRRARFSRLIREYQATGGTVQAGSKMAGFKDWLEGRNKIEVTNKIPANGRKMFELILKPFGMDTNAANLATEQKATVFASAYSLSGLQQRMTGVTAAELGHLSGADAAGATIIAGFYPALVIASYTATGAGETTRISGLTRQSYKYTYRRTFRIPFGRAAATAEQDFFERAQLIRDELDGSNPISISFEEEQFNGVISSGATFSATNIINVN